MGVELVLDEIVLRSRRDGASGHVGILMRGQDDNGNKWVGGSDAVKTVHPIGIGQDQVEQYTRRWLTADLLDGFFEAAGMANLGNLVGRPDICQHRLDQPQMQRVVLDEQQIRHHLVPPAD